MTFPCRRKSIAQFSLAMVALSAKGMVPDSECDLAEPSFVAEKQHCLLQTVSSKERPVFKAPARSTSISDVQELSWTTNSGQQHHNCSGSGFEVDFTGSHNGMAITNGLILKKGSCSSTSGSDIPRIMQALTCQDEATGCHMWCAPVWQSHYDTTDWSGFDSRCKGWNGTFDSSDKSCADIGKLFTWARAEVPSSKNEMELTFAIPKACTHWCSPLWVTIYDPSNWAKSYRWCFNQQGDWGTCDQTDDVPLNTWTKRRFRFSDFMEKHGYEVTNFVLELAVYAEDSSMEVMVDKVKLLHVAEKKVKSTTQAPGDTQSGACGSQKSCGSDHQCCRKGDSVIDAKCCPKDWSCCEDSCCPSYYTCTITENGHTCKPPTDEYSEMPAVCSI